MADYSEVKTVLNKPPQSKEEAEFQDGLERSITTVRTDRLRINPIEGDFNFEHISKIHYALFVGIKDHAGELRPPTEYWMKQSETEPEYIAEFATSSEALAIIEENHEFLVENNFLRDLDRDDFIHEATIFYAQINEAHPFLDGNGRTTRILFEQLANQAGYSFSLDIIDKKQWDKACLLATPHYIQYESDIPNQIIREFQEPDIYPLEDIMDIALQKLDKEISIEHLENALINENLQKDYPTLTTNQIEKINIYKDFLLEKYTTPEAQSLALQHLNKQIPDIASGKIVLPDLPQEKSKGFSR